MDHLRRQNDFQRLYRRTGYSPTAITLAARALGELRSMGDEEIEANLVALEDEVVRHLQVTQAIASTEQFGM